jgi:hypothetical protein
MKEKLSKCMVWADSQKVFEETPNGVIREFIDALENAKNFIDLTMRDEFLLTQAQSYIQHND